MNAIKLFFKTIQERKIDTEKIHRPKRSKVLPNLLSEEEVKLIFNAHINSKHKTMLSLIYSCGLRRSELLNFKPIDIDSKRGIFITRQSKGKKRQNCSSNIILAINPKLGYLRVKMKIHNMMNAVYLMY